MIYKYIMSINNLGGQQPASNGGQYYSSFQPQPHNQPPGVPGFQQQPGGPGFQDNSGPRNQDHPNGLSFPGPYRGQVYFLLIFKL